MSLTVSVDEIVANSRDGRLADGPGWGRIRLREVANVQNGFAFKSALFNKEGRGLPLLRIRDVGDTTTEAFYEGDYADRYLVSQGDVVVGMDGDFRIARWAGDAALLNQRVAKIQVREDAAYDGRFLLYALPAYLDAIHSHTSSVTVKHLSSRTIEDIPLPNPPLAEQQQIVAGIEEQFSRLDVAEGWISRAKANLLAMKSALDLARFADTWQTRPLEQLVLKERPICYGILMPKEHREDGVPYVRVKDYPNGQIEVESLRRTSREIADKYRRSTLRSGDVLLAIRGTYGRVALVPDELDGANITQDTARISPTDEVSSAFLVAYLGSEAANRYYRRVARGVAVRGVNLADV